MRAQVETDVTGYKASMDAQFAALKDEIARDRQSGLRASIEDAMERKLTASNAAMRATLLEQEARQTAHHTELQTRLSAREREVSELRHEIVNAINNRPLAPAPHAQNVAVAAAAAVTRY